MQEGQRVRGVLAGERDGLRVYASRAACGSGSGSIGSSTSGVVSSGPNSNFRIGVLAGERDGLRVYAVGDCYEPTVGTRHFGVLVGERDGKRVYAIDCCVPGSGSSGSGSSGSSGSESSGSSGSSTSVSGSGIGSEGSGSGSFSFSGPSGSISSGSGPGSRSAPPPVVDFGCCMGIEIPGELTVTLTGTGGVAYLSGSYTVTYVNALSQYQFIGDVGGYTIQINVICAQGPNLVVACAGGGSISGSADSPPIQCDPFYFTVTGMTAINDACWTAGTLSAVVTE